MPSQGCGSDEHCLWLTDHTRRLVEAVLGLTANGYVERGVFARGDAATWSLLDGVTVDVTALFAAEGEPPVNRRRRLGLRRR